MSSSSYSPAGHQSDDARCVDAAAASDAFEARYALFQLLDGMSDTQKSIHTVAKYIVSQAASSFLPDLYDCCMENLEQWQVVRRICLLYLFHDVCLYASHRKIDIAPFWALVTRDLDRIFHLTLPTPTSDAFDKVYKVSVKYAMPPCSM